MLLESKNYFGIILFPQFMTKIVAHCTHGINLHTGALHRANLDVPETEDLARAFGVPVILNSTLRDGSLREAAAERGIPMLLYEAGEALRFDELSIRAGVRGIIAVMRALGMLPPSRRKKPSMEPGIVIGRNNLPLVNEGEALFHIARFQDSREVAEQVEAFQVEQQNDMTINGDLPII